VTINASGAGVSVQSLIRFGEPAGRWVLLVTVLGSGLALLDATVVNVALPTLGEDLGASLAGLQWTINAYALTLAAFILLGGSLGDRYGRRRIFLLGVVWFALASLLCGISPTIGTLVAARALQGVGAALLTPGSLAIIQASFVTEDRARAIGAWSGFGGIAGAIGPFLGGWLVDAVSWRWIFLINLPVAVVVVAVAMRHVPESRDPTTSGRFDIAGAALGALGLAGLTYALIEAPDRGATSPVILVSAAVGIAAFTVFVIIERRKAHPMLPVDIFASRQFTAANLVTFAVYAALGGLFFFLVLQLRIVAGFSALAAGTALLPITIIMLLLSARVGALAQRIGPRLPMAVGPMISAFGLVLLTRVGPDTSYLAEVLPAVVVFGLGLALTVAPLTVTVLGAADARHAGVASGVNNAVARAAGLLAVAALPLVVGLSGSDYHNPEAFDDGFRLAAYVCAGFLAAGGLLAVGAIRNDVIAPVAGGRSVATAPAAGDSARDVAAAARSVLRNRPRQPQCRTHCAVGAPPLEPASSDGV